MRWAHASVVLRTSRAAAAFVLRLDALAAEECDRAAAAVAKHGRESLATQVRRACELVKDGLVERDTEVRSQCCSAKNNVVHTPAPRSGCCCSRRSAVSTCCSSGSLALRKASWADGSGAARSASALWNAVLTSRRAPPEARWSRVASLNASSRRSPCLRSSSGRWRCVSWRMTDMCARRNGAAHTQRVAAFSLTSCERQLFARSRCCVRGRNLQGVASTAGNGRKRA